MGNERIYQIHGPAYRTQSHGPVCISIDVPRLSYPKLGFPANQTSVFTRANPKKSLGIPPSAGWRAMLLAVEAVHWYAAFHLPRSCAADSEYSNHY